MDKAGVRARREGLRARSAYKLKELNKKYQFLTKSNSILDLGSWPGGWSIVAAKYAPVTAVDLTRMKPISNVTFIQGDLYDQEVLDQLPLADVVLSDAAPKTTGDSRDQYKSYLISVRALEIALLRLKKGGSFVVKIFQGEDFDAYLAEVRKHFDFVKCTKPPTSKNESKEMYIVGMDFLGREEGYEVYKTLLEGD